MMKVLRLAVSTIGLLVLLLPFAGAVQLAEAHVAAASKSWSLTGSMKHTRVYNTMTLLANGKVLVAGGIVDTGYLASAELYNPSTGIWSLTGSMNSAREGHTATLLANGQVLVAGGINADNSGGNPVLASAELYDPSTGTWSSTGSLNQARTSHTATKLTSGKALVAGGVPSGGGGVNGPPMATAELYG